MLFFCRLFWTFSLWTGRWWYLLGNCYFFIIFVRYTKCWPFRSLLLWSSRKLEICPWSRILFHIPHKPFRKWFFISESKTDSFPRISFKAWIHSKCRLSIIFRSIIKSIGFRNTINQDRFLQSWRTLFIINF
jgi:hypothetical protein